ncbi:MAG: hypothetical protein WD989_01865 [Candidatus Paceibacterota bacterium]
MTDRDLNELSKFPEIERLKELCFHQKRIQDLLEGLGLSPGRAFGVVSRLFDWAVELDQATDEIKEHPEIKKSYTYDGIFFERLNGSGFHVCHDGLNFLKMIRADNVEPFFRNGSFVEEAMLQWLESNYVEITRIRLEVLAERGTISLFNSRAKVFIKRFNDPLDNPHYH